MPSIYISKWTYVFFQFAQPFYSLNSQRQFHQNQIADTLILEILRKSDGNQFQFPSVARANRFDGTQKVFVARGTRVQFGQCENVSLLQRNVNLFVALHVVFGGIEYLDECVDEFIGDVVIVDHWERKPEKMRMKCSTAIKHQPSAARMISASRTRLCNSGDQFRSLKSIGITFNWHFGMSRLFRLTLASMRRIIPPMSISVQQTFRSEWMAAAILLNPTPEPISKIFRLANLCRLSKRKSANMSAPRHTCNPTSVKFVDFWCSISMEPLRFRFTIISPSTSIWRDLDRPSSASSASSVGYVNENRDTIAAIDWTD